MKTQKELGSVHLRIEGLDKERFKKLVEGHNTVEDMGVESLLDKGIDIIEHWFSAKNRWVWAAPQELIVSNSRLITLDELEQLLGVKKERTAKEIQEEIKALQRELEELRIVRVGDFVITGTGVIGVVSAINKSNYPYRVGNDWYCEVHKIDPNKTVKEVLGLD